MSLFRSSRLAGIALLVALAGLCSPARSATYTVTAVFDVRFDTEGRIVRLQPHEENEHAAAFWDALEQRISPLKIPAQRDHAGQAATLDTGLYVSVEVTAAEGGQGGGQLRIVDIDVKPLVLRKEFAGYPEELLKSAGWEGTVEAECIVGTNGRCGEVKVKVLPGMPPSLLRWANATLALWEFKPPQYNGVPFAARVQQRFALSTPDDKPVNFLYRGSGNAPFRW